MRLHRTAAWIVITKIVVAVVISVEFCSMKQELVSLCLNQRDRQDDYENDAERLHFDGWVKDFENC